jgi:hypothetical protein
MDRPPPRWLTPLLLLGLVLVPAGVLLAQVARPIRPSNSANKESPAEQTETPARPPEPAARRSSGNKHPPAAVQYLIALGALVLVLVIVCVPTREAE